MSIGEQIRKEVKHGFYAIFSDFAVCSYAEITDKGNSYEEADTLPHS